MKYQFFTTLWFYWRRLRYVSLFNFSIDASCEDGSLGWLVNDDEKSPNCKMKKLIIQVKPHLCLFAVEDIQAESEVIYNYGESKWPWQTQVRLRLYIRSLKLKLPGSHWMQSLGEARPHQVFHKKTLLKKFNLLKHHY